jgi:hypothetical protein
MAVNLKDIEETIRNSIPVTHLEIEDQSSGCGENYAIVLVSEVRRFTSLMSVYVNSNRLLRANQHSQGIEWVSSYKPREY